MDARWWTWGQGLDVIKLSLSGNVQNIGGCIKAENPHVTIKNSCLKR